MAKQFLEHHDFRNRLFRNRGVLNHLPFLSTTFERNPAIKIGSVADVQMDERVVLKCPEIVVVEDVLAVCYSLNRPTKSIRKRNQHVIFLINDVGIVIHVYFQC